MDEEQMDLLMDVNHCLKDLHNRILSGMPVKEGLIARPKRDTTVIIMKREIKRARAILHCSVIPKSKPVKRLQQAKKCRVGYKAEKQIKVCGYTYVCRKNVMYTAILCSLQRK